ncbi:MAG TPA: alpha/beta hydrolase [Actinomycetota bacterium]
MQSVAASVADERVRAAAVNWAPRFVANGTDSTDVQATLARIERWPEWCRQWGRTAAHYEALAERAEQRGRHRTAAGAWRRAGLCWHWGKFLFVDHPDEQRAAHERAVAGYQRGAWALDPPAERVEIPYPDEEFRLAAYLRLPAAGHPIGELPPGHLGSPDAVGEASLARPPHPQPPPVVVMAPGLDSVKEELQATADYFLERGLATLAIDGPGQGEAEYDLPIEPAYERVVAAACDWLEARPGIDPARIAVFGVSLGGYYAARAAAFEPRLRAAVALAGPYRFDREFERLPSLTRAAFQRRSGAASPEEAKERAAALSLEGVAERITIPLLALFGKLDRLIHPSEADQLAAVAPGGELVMFEDGNHGLTNHVYESRTLMADWLAEHLAPDAEPNAGPAADASG